jgi:hypothetical protein
MAVADISGYVKECFNAGVKLSWKDQPVKPDLLFFLGTQSNN